MIDLHIHSNNSDGSYSVEDILKTAEKCNLQCISITDHDNCDAYDILRKIKKSKIYTGKIIKGIELKCAYNGRIIDVLGYNYNIRKMKKLLKKYYPEHGNLQEKYLKHFYEACKKMNLIVTPLEQLVWDRNKDWAAIVMYNEIKKYPENEQKCPNDMWESLESFKCNFVNNKNSGFYIDKTEDYPSLKECINIIHKAKGKAFLAHAFIYEWTQNKEEFLTSIINNYNLDGIECYYTKFTYNQVQFAIQLCREKNLYMSGGSDFHGENKPGISLGIGYGNLRVPNYILEDWNKIKLFERIFIKKHLMLPQTECNNERMI